MKVEVLYFSGCPNPEPTAERLRQVIQRLGVEAGVREVEVTAEDDPTELKFLGSPTVLINGQDIDPACRDGVQYGFSCRTFAGEGVPPDSLIEQALLEAQTGEADGKSESSRPPAGGGGVWGTVAALPAVVVGSLPAVACPACWPAYAALLSSMGLGFLMQQQYLLPVSIVLVTVALTALAITGRSRRGYGPLLLGIGGGLALIIGRFVFLSDVATYAGVGLLVAAALWNAWPLRRPRDAGGSACCPVPRTSVDEQMRTTAED